jgi:hypothetical protein
VDHVDAEGGTWPATGARTWFVRWISSVEGTLCLRYDLLGVAKGGCLAGDWLGHGGLSRHLGSGSGKAVECSGDAIWGP